MIFTGYYAKLNQYKNLGLEPIAISGKRPDFYEGYTIAYDFKGSDYNSPRSFDGSCDSYNVCSFNGYNEMGNGELY